MSRLVRLVPIVIPTRRSYSFFSSKPGGGRYFNSAKPPKVVAQRNARASKTSTKSTTISDAQEADTASVVSAQTVGNYASVQSSSTIHPSNSTPSFHQHPIVNLHEFQLHQFFSLHRPLLLLDRPTSTLFQPSSTESLAPASLSVDDPPEASPEADADTARQLSRTLVINRVGSAVDWEKTLQRLGWESDPSVYLDISNEFVSSSIAMDSTKRKRRKKMKKHK